MPTTNPVLNTKTFKVGQAAIAAEPMTIAGTVNKTLMLLAMVLITASWVWGRFFQAQDVAAVAPYLWIGAIGGLVTALITVFRPTVAPYGAPVYALLEGLVIGATSAIFEARFPGIVLPAVGLTFGTLFCMLMAYKTGLVRATEKFKLGVVAATGGVALLYLVDIALGFFGKPIGFIHQGGTFGILFSAFVVVIAAMNLVLDFDFIETGAQRGAPKYMEWYGAFGLMVTLIWLYLEILRMLAKARSNR